MTLTDFWDTQSLKATMGTSMWKIGQKIAREWDQRRVYKAEGWPQLYNRLVASTQTTWSSWWVEGMGLGKTFPRQSLVKTFQTPITINPYAQTFPRLPNGYAREGSSIRIYSYWSFCFVNCIDRAQNSLFEKLYWVITISGESSEGKQNRGHSSLMVS